MTNKNKVLILHTVGELSGLAAEKALGWEARKDGSSGKFSWYGKDGLIRCPVELWTLSLAVYRDILATEMREQGFTRVVHDYGGPIVVCITDGTGGDGRGTGNDRCEGIALGIACLEAKGWTVDWDPEEEDDD